MKTALALSAFFLTSLVLTGQKTETRRTDFFNTVEVRNGILVQLVKSDTAAVKINTDADLKDIITEVKDGRLIIRAEGSAAKKNTSVEVLYTGLSVVEGYGKAEISNSSLIKQDSLTIILETGAKAYLDMDVKYLKSSITEGAVLSARGYAVVQDAYATTGATLSLFELESDLVSIKVTGNGKAKVYAEKSLTAEASSGGYILYQGDPEKWDTNTSLGGKIEKYSE